MTNPVKSGIQPMDKTHSTTASAALAKIEEDLESQKSVEAGNMGIDWMEKEHLIPFAGWQFVYKKPWDKLYRYSKDNT